MPIRRSLLGLYLTAIVTADDKVTFEDHIFPIFQQSCLNCHNPDKTKGGLDLSSFPGAMKGGSGGKVVEPGDVGSVLIASVQHTSDKKMPPKGDPLAAAEIDLLKKWIEGGLLENKSSAARKASKPKFETVLRSDPSERPSGPPPMPKDLLLEPPVLTARPAAIHALAASPWAPLLAITGQHQILLHNTETLELVGILPFPEGEPVALAFTPDGRYLIVGGGIAGKSGVTVTFDVTTGARLLAAAKEFDTILATDIRPGFDVVATGGPSRLLKLWNTETGELIKSVKKHTDWITALDLSNDGVLLASGDRNGGAWVWESDTANEFHALRGHQAGITTIQFRADSNLLATSSEDGTVRFWEMNGGTEVKKIDAHPGGVTGFCFAPDGSSVTIGRDMKVKFWKSDFQHLRDLAQDLTTLPTAVAIDSESKRAFVADALGSVIAVLMENGSVLGKIDANPTSIEVRLRSLDTEVKAGQTILAEISKRISEHQAIAESARSAHAKAAHDLHQGNEILKAAKTGAEQQTDEGNLKIAADAAARIPPAEQLVATRKSEFEAAARILAESTQNQAGAESQTVTLQGKIKHWKAASIHAKALALDSELDLEAGKSEESRVGFLSNAQRLTTLMTSLADRRAERKNFARLLSGDCSVEVHMEIRATLETIEFCIERELSALQATENALIATRSKIDTTATTTQKKVQDRDGLNVAYREELH